MEETVEEEDPVPGEAAITVEGEDPVAREAAITVEGEDLEAGESVVGEDPAFLVVENMKGKVSIFQKWKTNG